MEASIYNSLLEKFNPVTLNQLNHLKLMNRMDSKFVMPINSLKALLEKGNNQYLILDINGQRAFRYKTEYVDYPDFGLYLDHQNKRLNRFKIRYRTYPGSDFSFLEIKRKTNKGKTLKSRIEVPIDERLTESDYAFIESVVPLKARNLQIQTLNYFNRITLASFESNERITLDFGIELSDYNHTSKLEYLAIAEVKKEQSKGNSPFLQLLKEYQIHQSGFSKYCIGMALNNPTLKQNSFKPKILHLKKLEYASTIF